jgi:hypothetical protein
MKQTIPLVIIVAFSAGCMQAKALPHMNELLTLKAYSEEKDDQSKWVESRQKSFGLLLASVKDGSIKGYAGEDSIVRTFGEPVLKETVEDPGGPLTRWLYRHPIQKYATDRVYLYFTSDGRLTKSEHIPQEATNHNSQITNKTQ